MIHILQHLTHKPVAFLVKDFKTAISYRLNFIQQFLGVFLNIALFYMLSKLMSTKDTALLNEYGGSYFPFVLIGLAFSDYFSVTTESFSAEVRQAQVVGTLETLLLTPTSYTTIIFSTFIYKLLYTSFRLILYFLLGSTIFGAEFHLESPFLLLFTFVLTLLPFIGIGLLSAAFIIVLKQGSPISYLIYISSSLLGGVMYPVSLLPDWLEPVARVLPITYGLEAMRQILINGVEPADMASHLVILVLFSLVVIVGGIGAFVYSIRLAKKEGSLLHY